MFGGYPAMTPPDPDRLGGRDTAEGGWPVYAAFAILAVIVVLLTCSGVRS